MSTLMVKNMTCFPILHSAMAGTDITCVCSLQNVPRITAIHITGRQFHHEYASDDGLTGSFENNSVSLMVGPDAEDQISLTLASVTCEMEGEVIIEVNGYLSDIVSLRVIGKLFWTNIIYTLNIHVIKRLTQGADMTKLIDT